METRKQKFFTDVTSCPEVLLRHCEACWSWRKSAPVRSPGLEAEKATSGLLPCHCREVVAAWPGVGREEQAFAQPRVLVRADSVS